MTSPRVEKLTVRWLRGVIAAAVGLNLSACAEQEIADVADETGQSDAGETETGETETGAGETLPSEPFACPDAPIVVESSVLPDGTCAPCEGDCFMEAYLLARSSPDCNAGFNCWCDPGPVCSATIPNEDGLCLHGFTLEIDCAAGGRPLLTGDEVRVAPACARSDWSCPAPQLDVPTVLRERVREAWLARAAMEHASVAAFARFALQLLGLGAPADLIDAAQLAGRDETRHARLCYAIASQLGSHVGPDRLDLRGLELDVDPARVVLESILEGCIGETIAAAEMRYLATRAESPELAAMLEAIAEDEARHAALAWKALDWMLRSFDVGAVAIEIFSTAGNRASCSRQRPAEGAAARYGVLDQAASAWLAAEVLRDVITPAAVGLLQAPLAA